MRKYSDQSFLLGILVLIVAIFLVVALILRESPLEVLRHFSDWIGGAPLASD